jgi:hypothetical protein
LILLVLLALSCLPVAAQQVQMPKIEPTEWCGTQRIHEDKQAKQGRVSKSCDIEGPCDNAGARNEWLFETGQAVLTVRLAIHILAEDDGQYPTYTAAEVLASVAGLNSDYAASGIQFVAQIDTIRSTNWKLLDESEIDQMKTATAVTPDSCLNVWLPYVSFGYSFGTFPWGFDAQSPTGGIVMGQFHFQGGPNSVFSHEVGHCLGLWHTFHGYDEVTQCGSCYEYVGAPPGEADQLGDFCADTPPTPMNRLCEDYPGADPCTGLLWGETQEENFMNYSPEYCLTLFTPQQAGRMRCWIVHELEHWLLPMSSVVSNTFGPVPLDVDFAAATHKQVVSWAWDFGDGQYSSNDTVTHQYTQPGFHTVAVQLTATDGVYQHVHEGWVSAYADTVDVADVQTTAGADVAIDIFVHNYLPVKEIHIPFTWVGPLNLVYDSFSTAGLRTAYFDHQTQPNYDYSNRRAYIVLNCSNSGAKPYLEPGSSSVLKLWFSVPAGAAGATPNPVTLTNYAAFKQKLITYEGTYYPVLSAGSVKLGCCVGPSVGNVDSSPDNLVTMSDLTALIDNLFISFAPISCVTEADVDLSGQPNPQADDINMSDLTILIDHLFISFTPLPACP